MPTAEVATNELKTRSRATLVTCAAMLIAFAAMAWLSIRGKSATFDEPLHAVGGWIVANQGDFRVNPEDPPLWQYWAMLPQGRDALKPDPNNVWWNEMPHDVTRHWPFVIQNLYATPGVDGAAFINRSRAMMLPIALVLGALTAWWGWRLGGSVAAIVATAAFAFDPNFLAHGALVKNDVTFSLALLGLTVAIWRVGQRATIWNVLAAGLMCGVGMSVKFSGILLPPIIVILLLSRAILLGAWPMWRRDLRSRLSRTAGAGVVCVIVALLAWGVVWATYRFRFAPGSDPNLRLDTEFLYENNRYKELIAKYGEHYTLLQYQSWRPGIVVQLVMFLENNHLMPQAWTNGMLYTHMSVQVRAGYLAGQYSDVGWWYYFPLAFLFKTPLATLAAMGACTVAGLYWLVRRSKSGRPSKITPVMRQQRWTTLCFLVPVGVYLISAMTANLNLGIRHMLPVYPFAFIVLGIVSSVAWQRWRGITAGVLGVLGVGLLVETACSFPNYIPFFNVAFGGSRGGLRLLSDSNLDWGQDLPALAAWQRAHPGVKLYLSYFGTANPRFYEIKYVPLLGGYNWEWDFGEKESVDWRSAKGEGVVAVSATSLLGIYVPVARREYAPLWQQHTPIDVLGGSIYLYDLRGDMPDPPDAPWRIAARQSATMPTSTSP